MRLSNIKKDICLCEKIFIHTGWASPWRALWSCAVTIPTPGEFGKYDSKLFVNVMLLFLLLGSLGNMIHWKICIGDMPNDEGTMIIRGEENIIQHYEPIIGEIEKGEDVCIGG